MIVVKFLMIAVSLISVLVEIKGESDCQDVINAYQLAKRLNFLANEWQSGLLLSNCTCLETDPGFDLFIPTPADRDLIKLVKRSRILVKTAAILKQNSDTTYTSKRDSFLKLLQRRSPCLPPYQYPRSYRKTEPKFRPITGDMVMNNKNRVCGGANQPFMRICDANYEDFISDIKKATSKNELPKARNLVNGLLRPFIRNTKDGRQIKTPNMASLIFAQYLAHDIGSRTDVTNGNTNEVIQCCSKDGRHPISESLRHPGCIPVEIDLRDPDYKYYPNVRCLNMIRSEFMAKDMNMLSQADQLNKVTSYIDNSNLYGSDDVTAKSLRTFKHGKIKTNAENILPERKNENSETTFFLGDSRLTQSPQLLVFHSVFLREHNRVAEILGDLNPHWSDERTFQETRRIVVGELQNIVYKEFLPTYVDQQFLDAVNMTKHRGKFDEKIDAATFNEFSTAIFRIFHSFVQTNIHLIDNEGSYSDMKLNSNLLNSKLIKHKYDDICRGLLLQPVRTKGYDPDVFHSLFSKYNKKPGLDLISIDIQRGRDHGLPSYSEVLELINPREKIKSFEDLSPRISDKIIKKLQKSYENVMDIDLIIGAALENRVGTSLLGPTAQYIIVKQFLHLKNGDPYFYNHKNAINPFTNDQLKELEKSSLNAIFCMNSGVKVVPEYSSIAPASQSHLKSCPKIDKLDFGPWKEN